MKSKFNHEKLYYLNQLSNNLKILVVSPVYSLSGVPLAQLRLARVS